MRCMACPPSVHAGCMYVAMYVHVNCVANFAFGARFKALCRPTSHSAFQHARVPPA